jgi:hypothetical protein
MTYVVFEVIDENQKNDVEVARFETRQEAENFISDQAVSEAFYWATSSVKGVY